MTTGVLYGIGVGPGDPDLIPVKAVRILGSIELVFTAASTRNNFSLAVEIAKPHVPESATIEKLDFPMSKQKSVVEEAWQENARRIAQALESGKNAAFLTLGDPLIYSTYGYILRCLKEGWPHLTIRTVPGITSYQAAAASANQPLVEGEESLLILSGVHGGGRLRQMADNVDSVVFLKAYKNINGICEALESAGMLKNSKAVANCSRDNEKIYPDLRALAEQRPNYWTLVLAKKDRHAPKGRGRIKGK